MFCNHCGNKINDDAKVCNKCGATIQAGVVTKKRKFFSVSAESIFGIRWIKTSMAKIITGLVMLGVVLFTIADPDLNLKDMEALIVILLIGGVWYVYKGLQSKKGVVASKKSVFIWMTVIIIGFGILGWMALNTRLNTWITYSAPESNFSVDIPSSPTHDTKTQNTENGTIQIDTYMTANRTADVAYIVNVSSLPSGVDVSDSSASLKNTVQLTANNGTILNSTLTTKDGYPAIDYLIEFVHSNTTSRIRGLNILVNHKLYQLFTSYDKQQEYLLQFDKFANSFQINQ
jgi:hypothetical protein